MNDIRIDCTMEELLPVVASLAQSYTGCDSTSVTYEKAQELMEAVLYCLNEYVNSCTNGLVRKNCSVQEQYNAGVTLVLEKVGKIRRIFNEISVSFEDFGVRLLYDTVQKGIPQFLKKYDIKFCPQDTVLDLEYPLLRDCRPLTGADAVCQYIQDIQIEQRFFHALDPSLVLSILEKTNSAYRDMAENICHIVLLSAIGHAAIKKPWNNRTFLQEDYAQLSEAFGGKSIAGIENLIKSLIQNMIGQFYENDMELQEYLCCGAHPIAVRIDAALQYGQLNRVFVA